MGITNYIDTKDVTPGTETETLAGTITFTATVPGYRPGTDEVICSATASTSIGVLKDDGPHASLKYEITWDENAGEGKRYEGATVTAYCKTTNTGDCTVYPWPGLYSSFYHVSDAVFPSGTSWIEPIGKTAYTVDPGQSWTYTLNIPVRAKDVEQGFIDVMRNDWADYENPKGYVVSADNCEIHIPLTYPDGEEPEEAKPELTLVWNRDEIYHPNKGWELTTAPGTLNPEDWIKPDFTVINSGNVNLRIDVCSVSAKYGGLSAHNPHGLLEAKDSMGVGSLLYPASEFITPGTETEDILGTVTETYWVVGKDPETYEELCESNKITRTWKIGKESGWEIPEDSNLEGRLEVRPGYESSDPAGYQLGEPVSTILYVKNTGLVDLDSFTVSDPWDGSTFTDGPIAVGEEKSYVRADTTVQPEDVEREYIDYPAIQITWIDPDSEKERPTVAGPLHLTVLSKTGLLLKKGVAFGPEDGDYFKEGEPIQWSLTVTNNSKDAVTDITVEDKGKTVGSYAQITPGDTKNCTVPVHIVTEYDAKVVGYVLNSATATGTDYRGAVRTWPSNVAKALTKKPTVPGEDPKGDLEGLHPAITITKAEDPHGPLNGSYYEANEAIDYIITIRNVGDTELKDIAVTDSLAGFAPIGTLASLAPGEEKTFTYSYTVKDSDLPFGWIYNSATVTYTFGDGIKGTPKTSDTVQSRVGDDPFPPETPHLDPEKLPDDEDYCSLTLDTLGDTEARYTLHACAEHTEAAIAAEEAAQSGDWAAAAELWSAEVESLYETLYEAADSELKAALVSEKAAYDDYVDSLSALSHEAAAKELRVKSAFLCCALHTAPEELESSLAGDYAQSMGGETETESARAFGPLTGSDSEVTETYAGRIAYAQKNVLGLMDIEKSYDWDEVFDRGVQLWQSALDSEVNPIYKAADKETRKQIALWRISLDTLSAAEKPFLALLYEGNNNAITETQMNLYKDAAFVTSYLK
ncbi:MAG: hypothetical protein IJU28_09150 [Clostridia bacterium]|nr:hypothetical protein [Clostridia bacterium]